MFALTSQFGPSLVLCALVAGAAIVVAMLRVRVAARRGESAIVAFARVLAVGWALVIVLATAFPQGWPPRLSGGGDLVLELGRGGLSEWRRVLDDPMSWTSILLLANVIIYVPFAFLVVVAWPRHRGFALLTPILLSVGIETIQLVALGRVAATDDVLLNLAGALIGWTCGVVALRIFRPIHPRSDAGSAGTIR